MILCAGEALIDMLPRTLDGKSVFAPTAGGSVFNTAIGLGRLGADVSFFSGISTDLFGQVLLDALSGSKVDTRYIAQSDRPTTLAFVTLTDGHASYAFYDENTAGRMIGVEDLPQIQPDAIFVGGISLAVEPCADAYEALMRRAAPTSVTMIDPNIRPGFIKDEARYRARLWAMFRAADIIKTSDEDLAWIDRTADASSLLAQTGARVILLTRGGDGVTVVTKEGSQDIAAIKTTVVDTVGAGDTFSAGFLTHMQRSGQLDKRTIQDLSVHDWAEAAQFGARVAAITVSRAGANPPWATEI